VSNEQNEGIELHDSVLAEILLLDNRVELALRPAYIHQSSGQPGIDEGIGLVQDIIISIDDGSVTGAGGQLPSDIFDGEFKVNQEVFPNIIALPCDFAGAVTLTLHLSPDNRRVDITGTRVRVRREGPASYVEEFRP
jgi:hypothetical protein